MGLLFWTAVLAKAILALTLFTRRLAARYPWFTAFILTSLASELTMLWIPHRSILYTYTWIAVEPALWLLRVMLVTEAYHKLTEVYPWFDQRVSKIFFVTLGAAAVLSTLLLPIEIERVPSKPPIVTIYMLMLVAKRYLTLMAALFLGILISVCLKYQLPVGRNLVAHGVMLAVYFGFDAGACFASLMKGTSWATAYILPASFVLLLCWPFLYRRGADQVRTPTLTDEDLDRISRGWLLRTFISEWAWDLKRRR